MSTLSIDANFSETEKDAVAFISYAIESSYLLELTPLLKKITPLQFYRFSLLSETVHSYCLSTHDLDSVWQSTLALNNCPSIPIQSLDKKENISLYQLFLGLGFYQAFLNMNVRDVKRIETLNKACETGLYSALIVRIKTHISTIKNNGLQPKGVASLEKFLADTKRLSNLYLRLGYTQTAYFARDLSNHFYDLHLATMDSDAEVILEKAQYFSQIAVHNFICAGLLIEHPHSKQVWENIKDGKIIDAEILQFHTPESWTHEQTAFFLNKLGDQLFEQIYVNAELEIKSA